MAVEAADVVAVVAMVVAEAVVATEVTVGDTAVAAEVVTKRIRAKLKAATFAAAFFFYLLPANQPSHKSVIPNSCAERAGERDLTKPMDHQ